MKTIMAKSPHDSSFSISKRYFRRKKKADDEDNEEEVLNITTSSHFFLEQKHDFLSIQTTQIPSLPSPTKKKNSKFRSAIAVFTKTKPLHNSTLGTKVIGTLFGHRRGHVHFAIQEDPNSNPAFLIELATPTSVLVRQMASGVVRVALECEKKREAKGVLLLEEPIWRTYCNGRTCGYANRVACGAEEWRVLKAVAPISMGAGVLPESDGGGSDGELMYMRAKFERVVGSRDSEAFYMVNPDGSGGPELSIYLLRV